MISRGRGFGRGRGEVPHGWHVGSQRYAVRVGPLLDGCAQRVVGRQLQVAQPAACARASPVALPDPLLYADAVVRVACGHHDWGSRRRWVPGGPSSPLPLPPASPEAVAPAAASVAPAAASVAAAAVAAVVAAVAGHCEVAGFAAKTAAAQEERSVPFGCCPPWYCCCSGGCPHLRQTACSKSSFTCCLANDEVSPPA
eukprot:scaffold114137_cov18-Tisochrysis_lutea.AAC.1